MLLPSPQIAIALLLISIGLVVTFDIRIDRLKDKKYDSKEVYELIHIANCFPELREKDN